MAVNKYPIYILPEKGWRKGILGREILSLCAYAVIGHRVKGSLDKCIDDSLGDDELSLTEEGLPLERIPNLSTNLLGTRFQIKDFIFNPIKDGKQDWNEDDKVLNTDSIQVHINYETLEKDFFVVGWIVKEIDGRQIPYSRVFAKKQLYETFKRKIENLQNNEEEDKSLTVYLEEYENLSTDCNGHKQAKLLGDVRITHMPTKLNYWHFTIDLFPMEVPEKHISNTKKSWQKLMAENVRDFLRRSFYLIPKQLEPATIEGWENLVKKK